MLNKINEEDYHKIFDIVKCDVGNFNTTTRKKATYNNVIILPMGSPCSLYLLEKKDFIKLYKENTEFYEALFS